jgi:hypothetical protein
MQTSKKKPVSRSRYIGYVNLLCGLKLHSHGGSPNATFAVLMHFPEFPEIALSCFPETKESVDPLLVTRGALNR